MMVKSRIARMRPNTIARIGINMDLKVAMIKAPVSIQEEFELSPLFFMCR
jgi:hypothetical protein